MTSDTQNNYLVITASGEDKVGLVDRLSSKITGSGCNIEESRMAVLGGQFALIMLVSGPWNSLSKLEGQLDPLGEQLGLTILHHRTQKRERTQPAIPYRVEVVAMDHPGIVHNLSAFFSKNGINIEELQTNTYPAPHTGTPMFSVVMTVGIHANIHIPTLRGDFFDYCDDLNLDASFEPVRV
ncbi:MAG: glycine cleavage system protein R [Nitrosomonadales bacterium]|nr:glycine cleavage system protein R [Nitrosomonadales bacterium]